MNIVEKVELVVNSNNAIFSSQFYMEKNQKRQLGTLEGKMSVEFAEDFSMTDEELINL